MQVAQVKFLRLVAVWCEVSLARSSQEAKRAL
jgi:hypothetical protein